jgi:hypothetical protein
MGLPHCMGQDGSGQDWRLAEAASSRHRLVGDVSRRDSFPIIAYSSPLRGAAEPLSAGAGVMHALALAHLTYYRV